MHQVSMRLPQDAWVLRYVVQQCQKDSGEGRRSVKSGSCSRQDPLMPPFVGRQSVYLGLQPFNPHRKDAPCKVCMAVEEFSWRIWLARLIPASGTLVAFIPPERCGDSRDWVAPPASLAFP